MPRLTGIARKRDIACKALLTDARAILDAEGNGEAPLSKIKALVLALAARHDLFPKSDFAMPDAQGRNHPLAIEDGDGMGLYLTIAMPGREAAPHDHGIWCINAGLEGRELHRFFRRTDDGSREGFGQVEEIGQSLVAPGLAMVMADHAIHSNEIVGNETAWGLALYGYALARFPPVLFFHPQWGTTRHMPNRRPRAVVS